MSKENTDTLKKAKKNSYIAGFFTGFIAALLLTLVLAVSAYYYLKYHKTPNPQSISTVNSFVSLRGIQLQQR